MAPGRFAANHKNEWLSPVAYSGDWLYDTAAEGHAHTYLPLQDRWMQLGS